VPHTEARTRLPRERREEWVYGEGTGEERRLYLANARRIAVDRTRGAERLAGLPARDY
jgi:hypothetical protein